MNRARPVSKLQRTEIEEAALGLLSHELDEFVEISKHLAKSFGFLQSRLKSAFPKDCRKCGKVYKSFEDFYFGTDEIVHGTVSYPTIGAEFYLHRNCKSPCESTLVVVFTDRRDETALGFKRRNKFQECLEKLQHNLPIHSTEAREFLFKLLFKRIQQVEVERFKNKDAPVQLVDESKTPGPAPDKKPQQSRPSKKKGL